MHTIALFSALLAPLALAAPGNLVAKAPSCNADNCLRAVRATASNVKPAASQASADCQAFFQKTVAGPTVTVTQSASDPSTETAVIAARVVSTVTTSAPASSLPAYVASACGNTVRYSSACSCAGITSYGTVTGPATTVTVTATATSTSTPGPPACSSFFVRATDAPASTPQYVTFTSDAQLGAADKSSASAFRFLSDGRVYLASDPAASQVWASYPGSGSGIFAANPNALPAYQDGNGEADFNEHALFCAIAGGGLSGAFSCRGWMGFGYGTEVFQTCPESTGNGVVVDGVVDTGFDSSCRAVGLVAEAAC